MEKMTIEINAGVAQTFLNACALKNLDPDAQIERMMRVWLTQERRKPPKNKQLCKVLRLRP